MKRRIRVLAFVPNLVGSIPGQRASIEAWVPYLQEEAIDIEFVPFETPELREVLYTYGNTAIKAQRMLKAYARRVHDVWRDHNADILYIYREMALIGPDILEYALARTNQPIIYSLDDPIFVPSRSPFQGRFSTLKFPSKIHRIVRRSEITLANSRPIAAWARQYCDAVYLVPSAVDTQQLQPVAKESPSLGTVIGWSGSPSTAPNLAIASGALESVQRETGAAVRLVGGANYPLSNSLTYTEVPWSAETEQATIGAFDVGIAPMPDNPWNYWKFSGKVTYYMSLAVPTVATPMGDIPNQLRHGVDGFLASSDKEWVTYLKELVDNPDLRQQMGAAARASAERQFGIEIIGPKVASIIRSAARA